MTDKPWKQAERDAAALFNGTRYPANTGGPVDFETDRYVGQVKHVKSFSLAQLEGLAVELAELGSQKGKIGLVVIKRRSGKGHPTPQLIVLTNEAWEKLTEKEEGTCDLPDNTD